MTRQKRIFNFFQILYLITKKIGTIYCSLIAFMPEEVAFERKLSYLNPLKYLKIGHVILHFLDLCKLVETSHGCLETTMFVNFSFHRTILIHTF